MNEPNNTNKIPLGDMALAASVFIFSLATLCFGVWHVCRFLHILTNPIFLAALRHFNH